jgi:hypothetical protein
MTHVARFIKGVCADYNCVKYDPQFVYHVFTLYMYEYAHDMCLLVFY